MKQNNEFNLRWNELKLKQKLWVDKYNRSRTKQTRKNRFNEILKYEIKLESLRREFQR